MSSSIHRTHTRTRACRRVLAALVLLPTLATAQAFDLLVSTVDDNQLAGAVARDDDVIAHTAGSGALVAWPRETLSALAGQLGTSTLHHAFGDIDALHDGGGGPLAAQGLYLSIVSDEAGFLDGDVLHAGAAGFEVFLAEAQFAAATGATDGNVDVDAFQLDDDGQVLFSFTDNETSSVLAGATGGVINDGDVLSWNSATGAIAILFKESQIDAFVSQALGVVTLTGDTKGLARDPFSGAILFAVQAPTAQDGSVFSTAGGGSLLPGHGEAEFQFAGDFELDALSVQRASWSPITLSSCCPQPGETLVVSLRGAEPGLPHVVFLSLALGPPLLVTDGWGGLVTANDVLFAFSLQSLPAQTIVPDGFGEATIGFDVPVPHGPLDVIIQAVSLPWPHVASNPVVVEVAQ